MSDDPASGRPATGRRIGHSTILVVVLLGQFIIVASLGSLTVAAAEISLDLQASESQLQWLLVVYQLCYALMLTTGGRLGEIVGQKRVFTIGIAVFVAASTLAWVAPSAAILIVARGLMGIGGGLASPQVLSIILVAFEGEARPRALSMFAFVSGAGFIAGQLISGVLIELDLFGWSWRLAFVFNVVVGAGVVLASVLALPQLARRAGRRFDLVGASLMGCTSVLVLYPIIQGRATGWPPITFVLLGLAIPVGALLAFHQRRLAAAHGDPVIDPEIIGLRSFRGRRFGRRADEHGGLRPAAAPDDHPAARLRLLRARGGARDRARARSR